MKLRHLLIPLDMIGVLIIVSIIGNSVGINTQQGFMLLGIVMFVSAYVAGWHRRKYFTKREDHENSSST